MTEIAAKFNEATDKIAAEAAPLYVPFGEVLDGALAFGLATTPAEQQDALVYWASQISTVIARVRRAQRLAA